MTTFLNARDPILPPSSPNSSSRELQHRSTSSHSSSPSILAEAQCEYRRPRRRLHEPWEVAFLDHLRRRNAFYQARLIGTQSFRFLWLQFRTPVVLVELHRPDPRRRGTYFIVHASTSPIVATRRAWISAIPRASLLARSRPLQMNVKCGCLYAAMPRKSGDLMNVPVRSGEISQAEMP